MPFLMEQFDEWPPTARLYRDSIAVEQDITPETEEQVAELEQIADGMFYVVVYPGDPITAIITIVVTLALTAAVLLFLTPKIPGQTQYDQSSNNSLSGRSNKPRPNGRIEDIFGTVISIPTLLTVPYSVFENNVEVEIAYMSIGRGQYSIARVRDGDTNLASISGASAAIYGPYTSPNSGDTPQLQIGPTIAEQVMTVVRLNDVNGQPLRPTNVDAIQGNSNIRFVSPDTIEALSGSDVDFTTLLGPGDALSIQRSTLDGTGGMFSLTEQIRFNLAGEIEFDTYDPTTEFGAAAFLTIVNGGYAGDSGLGGVTYIDVSGTYPILSVSSTKVVLDDPASTNPDWNLIDDYSGDETEYHSVTITTPRDAPGMNLDGNYTALSVSTDQVVLNNPVLVNTDWGDLAGLPGSATAYVSPVIGRTTASWVGPFTLNLGGMTQVVVNIQATGGLYAISKKNNQGALSVDYALEVTPIDDDGTPIGSAELFPATITGSATERNAVTHTLKASITVQGPSTVRLRRTSPQGHDENWSTSVQEIKWKDCYGMAPVVQTDFGDVTTVLTRTIATAGALSVKERKLNMEVTRKVLVRNVDNTFGPALVATSNAANIICHMALDPYIGGRGLDELDVAQIFDTVAEVVDYFGIPDVGQFRYTFDQDNLSFEEMVQSVAQAVFCTAYRQGSELRLFFERETEDSTLLFNHRNKVPGSETRTVRFGTVNDNDGVEFDYVSAQDGSKLTIYLPDDQSATKPKKLEVIGVQSEFQAMLHACRAYNKIKYQHTTTQFGALSEATQLVLSERIEVADNTRADTIDGHVVSQDGLILELSQPFEPAPGLDYVVHLQLPDGSVQVIDIAPGADEWHIVLQSAPTVALVMGPDIWADVVYQIVGSNDVRPSAFLLTEKGAYDRSSLSVQAINYDQRYYQNDQDYAS